MKRALIALSLLLPAPALADGAIALEGATVHLGNGETLAGHTVVIEGRKIVAVGRGLQLPAGCQRVDLKGQHLFPGLIDMDSVLGLIEVGSVRGTVDVEEVGRLNPNLRSEQAVNPDSDLIPVSRTGGVLLALTSARSGLVPGCSALIQLDGWTYEEMTVRAPAFLHVRWPSMRLDRSKRGEEGPEKQLEQREEQLRALDEMLAGARAYWRARQAPEGRRPVPADVQWEALRGVIEGLIPVALHAEGLVELRAALRWAEEEGLRPVLVGAADAWRIAHELAKKDVPVILGPAHELPRRAWETVDVPFESASKLHAAGVRIAFGMGGDGFAAANARNLRLSAAQYIAHGLPVAAAEKALTLGAAEIAGVADRLGSLAEGKEATLFVCDGDLFEFPTRVTRAWIAGREVSLVDKQLRLYDRYRARPKKE